MEEIESALAGLDRVAELDNGAEDRALLIEGLQRVWIERPSEFWCMLLLATKALRGDDEMSELAERLMAEGRTTFADAREAIEKYNSVRPKL